MVRLFTFICVLMFGTSAFAEWKPASPRLLTRWAKDVTPDKVLPDTRVPISAGQLAEPERAVGLCDH